MYMYVTRIRILVVFLDLCYTECKQNLYLHQIELAELEPHE